MSRAPRIGASEKLALIRDIASGEMNRAELAAKYGRALPTIDKVRMRHRTEIAALKQGVVNELDALWIADKANRIAEYQSDVHLVNGALEEGLDPKLLRAKHSALRSVAEEMGSLPARVAVQVNTQQVLYQVEGIDPEALR
jgi:hypothetical protein